VHDVAPTCVPADNDAHRVISSMRRSDYRYDLPPALIAQYPLARRSASRMLHLDRASRALHDRVFADLPRMLRPGDLLILNDTRVMPARLFGVKASGGRIEILIERVLAGRRVLALIGAAKKTKAGSRLRIEGGCEVLVVEDRGGGMYELEFQGMRDVHAIMAEHGHVPLPPYIERPDEERDRARYQTVFARAPGAVAAPTAGLHFDEALFGALEANGIGHCFVTLHVGAGTFQPIRTEAVEQHRMHAERCTVTAAACERIDAARRAGGRIVAVGTTVVRALESAAASGRLQPYDDDTAMFIYPGYGFHCVDAMITNFHLPESTLLLLVAAFAGREPVLDAYRHAVAAGYRFYSYGDAMLIT
jgi:S-adenosylmethionine:tRNA ribosyltransferase-isomerase